MLAPPDCSDRARAILRALGPQLDQLVTPALVFDLEAVRHNVAAMVESTTAGRWRPHVKTLKQTDLVRALLEGGVTTFKCATLDELKMTLEAAGGAAIDVLIAYPLHVEAVRAALRIADAHPASKVRLLIDGPEHLATLDEALQGSRWRPTALLDVDVGMGRTGTSAQGWGSPAAEHLDLVGLHGYEGHLAWGQTQEAIAGYDQLLSLAGRVGFPVEWIVTSGTHAFHHALNHQGLSAGLWRHQVSPGTIVLSDLRSAPAAELLGLQQAAFVLSRVVSTPGPGRITLDAGSKALNPDCAAPACAAVGLPDLHPETPSEEHRPCGLGAGTLRWGEVVVLVPEHVCTTVNLYRSAWLVRGASDVGVVPISAMSRTARLEML